MNFTHCFHSIQPIEFKSTSIESRREVVIAWEIFLLDLELRWPTQTITHIGCMIHRIAYIQSMFRILRVAFVCMELCFLLISRILRIRIYSFSLQSLSNNLTFYEFLSSPKIIKCANNLRVSRYSILFEIKMLWPEIVLHPRSSVFLVGCIVESAFGCTCECIFARLPHFIYNLNIIL